MEISGLGDAQLAVRLVCKGLRPELLASRDEEYGALIRKYEADPGFREDVRAQAKMLDLVVMEVTSQQIVLRPSGPGSVFRKAVSQWLPESRKENRGLHALALVAVAAAFFKTGYDLTGRPSVATLGREHIDEIFTELCEAARKRAGDADALAGEGQAEAWRAFLALDKGEPGDRGHRTRQAIVANVVRMLVDQGMLRQEGSSGGATFTPTERFRIQLRDVMSNEIYAACLSLVDAAPAGDADA